MDLLRFEIIRENYRKERDDYKINLACGPQEIELFIIKNTKYKTQLVRMFKEFLDRDICIKKKVIEEVGVTESFTLAN